MFYQDADFWLSAITLLLVLATFWLALETRGLRKDSARSIKASEETAKAASESVKTAQESMQRTLRAYVTVDSIVPRTKTAEGVPREVDISVINTGQTPARHVEVQHCAWLLENTPTSFSDFTDRFRTWMPTDLGQGQRRTVHSHFIGRDELLSTVVNNEFRFVVCGVVRYRDMLSDEERRTEFCFVWDQSLQGFYPAGPMNSVT